MKLKEKIYKSTNMKIYQILIVIALLIITFILTTRLFIYQAEEIFESDLPAHISDALDESINNYSITSPIYKFLYNNVGGAVAICVFLSIINIVTIPVTKRILDYFIKDDKHFLKWLYAIGLDYAIAIVILPLTKGYWNVGLFQPTIWHNSTYLCMKLFGLLATFYFFKIRENYLEKIKIHEYIIFTILLFITNSIKPNFILMFAPAVAVLLLIDFIKCIKEKNKKGIAHIFAIGISILLSLSVLLYQNYVVYGEGSQEEGGIEFGFLSVYVHYNRHPVFGLIQSFALPLFIFIANFKKFFKNKNYVLAFLMDIFSLLTFFFINETGDRKFHGNFSWGVYLAVMITYILSVVILHNSKYNKDEEIKHKKAYLITGYSLFIAHVVFGLIYFAKLQLGGSYY